MALPGIFTSEQLDHVPENVLVTDLRGRILAANARARKAFSLTAGSKGDSVAELFPFRPLDQLPVGQSLTDVAAFEDIARALDQRELRVGVKVVGAGPDHLVWLMADLSSDQDDKQKMIDYMAELTTAQAKIRDYTRQIEIFRLIVDGMDQGVFLTNETKRVTFANTFVNKLFGFELTGCALAKVLPLFSHIGALPLVDSGLEELMPLRGEVLVLDELRGRETRCFLNVAPLSREGTEDRTLVWTLFELTEEIANTQAFIDFSAELAALNRDLTRKNEEILRLSHTDFLTQIPNRGYIFELLDKALDFAAHHRQPLSVLLFDVDNFKSFNDHLGHEVGDAILKAICATTVETLDGQGTVGRYGGEEFLVILPAADLARALELSEAIRRAIDSRNEGIAPRERVTISGGVAPHRVGESRDALLRQADRLLYQAKNSGKNCIASDSPS